MTLVVTFTGRTPLATSGPRTRFEIWSYTVQPALPSDLAGMQRIALALPAGVEVQDPRLFPDVPALNGAFLEHDTNISRQYVGRVLSGLGTQTISFVAPPAQGDRELFLVGKGPAGRTWTVVPFAKTASGDADNVQVMPAPTAGSRVVTGRPLPDFTGALPYASESFGLYQPLLGWRSQRTVARFLEGIARADQDLLALVSQQVTPDAAVSDGGIIHLGEAEAAADDLTLTVRTGTALAAKPYSPLIDSVLADLLQQRVKGKDLRDPAVWLPLLKRTALDTMLANEVTPELFRRTAATTDPTRRKALLQTLARKESMVAGLLNYLSEQALVPTLADLFTAPAPEVDAERYRDVKRMLDPLETLSRKEAVERVSLSPVGVVHLFRQYFFEFDTFLGPPVQHVWLSPGGTVELVEAHTRKTVVERSVESSLETTEKAEKSITQQDDVSEAVKQENESSTKLGFSVSSNQRWVWGDANETATMDMSDTQRQAREQTHKQMRQQSERLSTEIKRSFKTTFRTVTETTDTASRRYVLQNTTDKLVNYELRRKMRRVGVQVQDLGTQLCWQSYVDDPGRELGLAKLVHLAAPPDMSSAVPANELPVPDDYSEDVVGSFTLPGSGSTSYRSSGHATGIWLCDIVLHPKDGYTYLDHGSVKWTGPNNLSANIIANRKDNQGGVPDGTPLPTEPSLSLYVTYGHGQGGEDFPFSIPVKYTPTADKKAQIAARNVALAKERTLELDRLQREAYMKAAVERIDAASRVETRSYDVLREEERVVVYRRLLQHLLQLGETVPTDPKVLHRLSELINSIFDVDAMLYFVAPEWWRPRMHHSHPAFTPELDPPVDPDPVKARRRLPVPVVEAFRRKPAPLDEHVVGWFDKQEMLREDNYYITGSSAPARMGSSLGWLMQLDADHQRNAFLNAPWVKAVMPIRPGKELAALNWLSDPSIEGAEGLDDLYQPASAGENGKILGKLRAYPWSDPDLVVRYRGLDPAALTVRDVLRYVAISVVEKHQNGQQVVTERLEDGVTLNYLPPDKVYEHGFYPLVDGFKAQTQQPYEVFDQWVEVLPTDQMAAVQVTYNPLTGQQG
ncbi:hypothetical protein A8W25_28805 [Streptomyces sp. ERV7]|uniref:hypothetical protein n=1 Tax=Streptomyces sp. ERV7 TaxID=1322334 RepID=UPI0007F37BC9|nr:hypothetical protein [Streptomyces sp. ERV7]OAR25038.1 hypothetical protein A8W25_28805 [Streptomyces sp. ERV7]